MIPKLEEYKKRWDFNSDPTIKPGLDSIKEALRLLGHPEQSLTVIHVSGTNGKGSTIQLMEGILQAHGFTTGTFTSPAVKDMHDQIRYNTKAVTGDLIDQAFEQLKAQELSGCLTDFELLTVIAFIVLKKLNPDYVFIETGMGGLLDSTNVVNPIASVITSIALDHTDFLGGTIAAITAHKAGIIKKEVPVISGRLPIDALTLVEEISIEKQAPLYIYGKAFQICEGDVEVFKGKKQFTLAERKMKGAHQRVNVSIAIETLLVIGISLEEKLLQKALLNTQLSYRFEEVLPDVFVDGAHNPAAALALRKTIEEVFPGETVDFVIGMLKRKDVRGTIDALLPVANSFTFINFDHPDAVSPEVLLENCEFSRKQVTKVNGGSIILKKNKNRRIMVTGSLYLLATLDIKVEN